MDITKVTGLSYEYINSAYYTFVTDNPVTKKIIHTNLNSAPADNGLLMQYDYFDFSKFTEAEYTGEIFSDSDYFLMKIAVPTNTSTVVLRYNNIDIIRLTFTSERERVFNTVALIYQDNEDEEIQRKLDVLIHETNYANPHHDQIAMDLVNPKTSGILITSLVDSNTNRYRVVPFGNYSVTEDGCKYWMGNFTESLEGV